MRYNWKIERDTGFEKIELLNTLFICDDNIILGKSAKK